MERVAKMDRSLLPGGLTGYLEKLSSFCLEQQNQEEQSEQNPLWGEFPPLKLALIEP
jgi:hypothetical protein